MGSPPSASTARLRAARGTSAAGTPASIVGVVSARVARDSARHEPRLHVREPRTRRRANAVRRRTKRASLAPS